MAGAASSASTPVPTATWLCFPAPVRGGSAEDDFLVGSNGSFNQLVVSNGAMLINADGELGQAPGSSNNLAWITGAGSLWTNRGILTVGFYGVGNTLVVSNGATLANLSAALASKTASSSNLIWVTGSVRFGTRQIPAPSAPKVQPTRSWFRMVQPSSAAAARPVLWAPSFLRATMSSG